MNASTAWYIITIAILVNNSVSMLLSFPGRFRLRYSIFAIILFTTGFYTILRLIHSPVQSFGGVRGLVFFLLFVWLLKGGIFQKLFAFFLPYLLTMWLYSFIEVLLVIFLERGTSLFYTILVSITLIVYAAYLAILIRFGRRLFRHLFELGHPTEWAVYSLGALFSFFLLMFCRNTDIIPVLYILILLFIFWSFGVLCYAIIKTHEKSKKTYEAEFAQGVISTGRGHYQKLNEMYDTLSILRHDYKYHLNTISELVNNNDIDGIKKYLSGVRVQIPDNDLQYYCKNAVLNALLGSYAERCAKSHIEYDVQLAMPETLSITNYDMCIILGNLLENAVEACNKLEQSSETQSPAKIGLLIKTQGKHLAVMVKNNFNGIIAEDNGLPISVKKYGGFGLRSIAAVASRYDGNIFTEWNADTFTAYVMLRNN